jgi:hypothetical protein
MDLLSTGINAFVVGAVGLLLAWFAKGRFEEMEKRFDGRFQAIEGRLDRIEARVDGMRSDLTQVALAVGARPRTGNP